MKNVTQYDTNKRNSGEAYREEPEGNILPGKSTACHFRVEDGSSAFSGSQNTIEDPGKQSVR